jgi:hypothetical protein
VTARPRPEIRPFADGVDAGGAGGGGPLLVVIGAVLLVTKGGC